MEQSIHQSEHGSISTDDYASESTDIAMKAGECRYMRSAIEDPENVRGS